MMYWDCLELTAGILPGKRLLIMEGGRFALVERGGRGGGFAA